MGLRLRSFASLPLHDSVEKRIVVRVLIGTSMHRFIVHPSQRAFLLRETAPLAFLLLHNSAHHHHEIIARNSVLVQHLNASGDLQNHTDLKASPHRFSSANSATSGTKQTEDPSKAPFSPAKRSATAGNSARKGVADSFEWLKSFPELPGMPCSCNSPSISSRFERSALRRKEATTNSRDQTISQFPCICFQHRVSHHFHIADRICSVC